nr:hypothetical protein [uncultured Roseateles sp.]
MSTDDFLKATWAEAICARVSDGATIREIAKEMACSPSEVLRRATYNDHWKEQYARARDFAAELFEDEVILAARGVTNQTANAERVRIDALKWVAAKRRPKVYGDRVQQVHTDPDGKPLPAVQPTVTLDASKLTDEALRAIAEAREPDPDDIER